MAKRVAKSRPRLRTIYKTARVGPVYFTVVRDSEWDEYRVRQYVDGVVHEERDYFTPDKEDAMETAKFLIMTETLLWP